MTAPKAKTIESLTNFSGLQKDWIKAVAREAAVAAVAEVRTELLGVFQNSSAGGDSQSKVYQDIVKRLDSVESRYVEDDKYTLTKAKLVRLMKQLGID